MAQRKRALTIHWSIGNFSLYMPEFWDNPLSSTILPRTFSENACYFNLHLEATGSNDPHKVLLVLHSLDTLPRSVDIEWAFLDSDGTPVFTRTMLNQTLSDSSSLLLEDGPTCDQVFVSSKSLFLQLDTLSVRCTVWISQSEFKYEEYFYLKSQISRKAREHSELWTIDRFSTLRLRQYVTKSLTLSALIPDRICLRFSLTGASLLDSVINCEIISNDYSNQVSLVKVVVLDTDHKAIAYGEKCEVMEAYTFIAPESVSRKELICEDSRSLNADVLHLLCTLTYTELTHTSITEISYYGIKNIEMRLPVNVIPVCEESDPSHDTVPISSFLEERSESFVVLREDLMSLYRESRLSDFELRSGDISFPVHKVILSARSPVFRDMFSNGVEPCTNFLDVTDLKVHTLTQLLVFLYTGSVKHLQWEGAVKLYYAADKFQVHTLKQRCSSFMQSAVTVSNVGELLTLANRHRDQELKEFVDDFLLSNFHEVTESEEWERFLEGEEHFVAKTMHHLYKKIRQM